MGKTIRSRTRFPHSGGAVVLLALLFVTRAASAGEDSSDLGLTLELEHSSALQFEPLHVVVTVRNNSGTPINVGRPGGEGNARLSLKMQRTEYERIARRSNGPIVRRLAVPVGGVRQAQIDLGRWYNIAPVGQYMVQAALDWRGKTYESNKELFDIVRGIEMRKVTRTLPDYADVELTYSLRYWNRPDRGHSGEFLFLSVDDGRNRLNYGVFLLGRLIRVYEPVFEVDRRGLIKVVHQSGRDCYTRTVLTASLEGVQVVDQTYHLANGDPYPYIEGRAVPRPRVVVSRDEDDRGEVSALRRWWRIMLKGRRESD